jgi:hypothetical protein
MAETSCGDMPGDMGTCLMDFRAVDSPLSLDPSRDTPGGLMGPIPGKGCYSDRQGTDVSSNRSTHGASRGD